MIGSEKLKAHLETFAELRAEKRLVFQGDRTAYAAEIAKCFMPCARGILAGYFKVTNVIEGKTVTRTVKPTVIELYYHEEGDGRFKDPIMYHTNDRKYYEFYKDKFEEYKDRRDRKNYFDRRGISSLPYYPVGSLNPHPSGIDVTFENPSERYRASFLIREYEVSFDGGKPVPIPNSTDLYDDLLLNGITLENADWIEWVDGDAESITLKSSPRKNVSAYEKYKDSPELWRKVVRGTDAQNKPAFEPCSFGWHFSVNSHGPTALD